MLSKPSVFHHTLRAWIAAGGDPFRIQLDGQTLMMKLASVGNRSGIKRYALSFPSSFHLLNHLFPFHCYRLMRMTSNPLGELAKTDRHGQTVLTFAIKAKQMETIKWLFEQNVDWYNADNEALCAATIVSDLELFKYLAPRLNHIHLKSGQNVFRQWSVIFCNPIDEELRALFPEYTDEEHQ